MDLNKRILAFAELGKFLKQFTSEDFIYNNEVKFNSEFYERFSNLIYSAKHKNGWFLPKEVAFSIKQWVNALQVENLEQWLKPYTEIKTSKTVGIVMAGNIPLVGFHDLLSVLITGHKALVKLSSNDAQLIPFLCEYLVKVAPSLKDKIAFAEGKFTNFEAVIATGSNNTARYFEYYFKGKPNIIRKNRSSVAVLTGKETKVQLNELGKDIFTYYGLGCRSVSKLFVPEGYNFDNFFKAIFDYSYLLKQEKYVNNYDYNKAVYLMSRFKLLDNGFLMLKEDKSYSSPIATVFYEKYTNYDSLATLFIDKEADLQCVVNYPNAKQNTNFGKTQSPSLNDYADGVDIIEFLLKI